FCVCFFFQAEDGIRDPLVTGVQTCALPIWPPLVDRPIYASFDEQGRLYVVDSSGSNDKPDKQMQEKPHRIVQLEDANADGKFERSEERRVGKEWRYRGGREDWSKK